MQIGRLKAETFLYQNNADEEDDVDDNEGTINYHTENGTRIRDCQIEHFNEKHTFLACDIKFPVNLYPLKHEMSVSD